MSERRVWLTALLHAYVRTVVGICMYAATDETTKMQAPPLATVGQIRWESQLCGSPPPIAGPLE